MAKLVQVIIICLLIPSLIEAVDADKFLIGIPGSPLSLGRITFVMAGVLALLSEGNLFLKNHVFYAFVFIFTGLFTGAIIASDMVGNLSKTIALVLIFIGLCGLSKLWGLKFFQILLDGFFLFVFIYWVHYILSHTFENGKFLAYSILYWNDEVINHHVPGFNISISSVYLATRIFIRTKFQILGWVLLFLTILLCLVIESRSNFLFTSLAGVIILVLSQKNRLRIAVIIAPIIIVAAVGLFSYVSQYDSIVRRFDVNNTEYQSQTTDSRLQLIKMTFDNLGNNPLGNGIENIKLRYDVYRNFLVHNQYLSFIIGGGILALLGVILWAFSVFRLLRRIFSSNGFRELNIYVVAIGVLVFTFHITLLTIDTTGLMFFVIISLLIYATNEVLHTRSKKALKGSR